ncbi:hypothetical protein GK047_28315 [Paenibacillus sp. SYP-B3998]|uniref:Flagellar hook-associated protein 2 C-terminal domain-containing protein n=1 Tax=Paenibacillus sp. SYP-B3998 TaxID=2678564 RepID=A0A6G4A6A8_9BACL|nr:hypothetical protein [Paenibacillus sp. SYP-B3998]NEW09828.1 hypothetical protein [Paenibacillus sp. SYP-B3998]
MINPYPCPIAALNSYQTNKDYYRVSRVSAITGGKTSTSRAPLNRPYEQSAYKQLAESTAKGLAGFLHAAQNVKQTAQTLAGSSFSITQRQDASLSENADSEAATQPIQEFVDAYNTFQKDLRETPEYLNRSLLRGLEQAAKPYALNELGISELADGTLELQKAELRKQIKERSDQAQISLGNIKSFAASFSTGLGQLDQFPSEALFQMASSSLKPYGQYRSKLQAYLPVPMSGLLLDQRM